MSSDAWADQGCKTGEHLAAQATHKDAGNPIDYAVHIPVERIGAYDGVIRISGPAGAAEVTFLQQVAPKRGLSGILIAGFPFLLVLALLGGIWYARAGSRPAGVIAIPSGLR